MLTAHSRRVPPIVLVAAVAIALTAAAPQAHAQVNPPAVPANLEVQAGNTPFLIGHALGTQNYICVHAKGGFEWLFFGPQATLFGDDGEQISTHFLSGNPDENGTGRATWQDSEDSSRVWAVSIASSIDRSFVRPDAIAWLLLRVVGRRDGTSGDTLSDTTFIQRVNTTGGLAPATGCRNANDIGIKALVPYTADYVFYR